jgi:ribosomal protein S18 acetylase RimI-like enzyme
MENIKTRRITINDIDQLKEIGKLTFTETFSSQNSEENLKEYLKRGFSTEKLRAELTNKNSEFYFAELEDKTIGYLKINFGHSQTEIKQENTLEIERIYILKEFHGKKFGQVLYEKAIGIAKQKKVDYVWLGVWEENPRAIRFYEKNRFVAFDKHIFKLGNDEQTDIMMKLKLN